MTPGIKLAFAGIGIAMNLMFLALSWAAGAERRRLLREGQQAPGRVTDITSEGPSVLPRLTLHYEFTPAGRTQPVQRQCRLPAGVPRPRVGEAVVVCYNPASPKTSVVVSPKGLAW